MIRVQPQFFQAGQNFGTLPDAAFFKTFFAALFAALFQQALFLRFQQVSVQKFRDYHDSPYDFRNCFKKRSGYAICDTEYSQPDDEFVQVVRIVYRVDAVPIQGSEDANLSAELERLDYKAFHSVARTLSGAQACMTAWVEAISGRAAMTRTRATSRPSASLAKAAAAPSGLP